MTHANVKKPFTPMLNVEWWTRNWIELYGIFTEKLLYGILMR